MLLRQIRVEGLRRLPELTTGLLDRVVTVRGDGPVTTAFVDGLELFFAAFSEDALRSTLEHLRVVEPGEEVEIDVGLTLEEARWESSDGARALVHPEADRTIRIGLTFELDPPQYAILREHAVRDPFLVKALAAGPEVSVQVGYLFNRSFDSARVGPLSMTMAGQRVPVVGKEVPAWVYALFQNLGGRFLRVPFLGRAHGLERRIAKRWLDAQISADQSSYARATTLSTVLSEAPFSLSRARPVRWNGKRAMVVAGSEGVPIGRLGGAAVESVLLAGSVGITGAEILVAEAPGLLMENRKAVLKWLARQATEAGAPLEQVFLCGVTASALKGKDVVHLALMEDK